MIWSQKWSLHNVTKFFRMMKAYTFRQYFTVSNLLHWRLWRSPKGFVPTGWTDGRPWPSPKQDPTRTSKEAKKPDAETNPRDFQEGCSCPHYCLAHAHTPLLNCLVLSAEPVDSSLMLDPGNLTTSESVGEVVYHGQPCKMQMPC